MEVTEGVDRELSVVDGDEGAGGAADLHNIVRTLETHFGAGARQELFPIHLVCGHIRFRLTQVKVKVEEAPGVADERLEQKPVSDG